MSRQIFPLGLSHNVEVLITNTLQTKFQFSDSILLLDDVLINGIFLMFDTLKSPSFTPLLPFNQTREGLLTLEGYQNQQFNARFPLSSMLNLEVTEALGVEYKFEMLFLHPKKISIRNSFLEFPNIATWGLGAPPYSVAFTFFYEKYDPNIHQLNSWGELIKPHKKSLPPAAPVQQTKPPAGAVKFRGNKPKRN